MLSTCDPDFGIVEYEKDIMRKEEDQKFNMSIIHQKDTKLQNYIRYSEQDGKKGDFEDEIPNVNELMPISEGVRL